MGDDPASEFRSGIKLTGIAIPTALWFKRFPELPHFAQTALEDDVLHDRYHFSLVRSNPQVT